MGKTQQIDNNDRLRYQYNTSVVLNRHMEYYLEYIKYRIIPALAMMMLLTAFIIPHMGSGPFWAMRMWAEADKCKKYWWTNFLAISNFIDVENQCLIVSWYISCLLQFVVIGTIVVYVRAKNRKVGIFTIVIIFLLSLTVSFVVTYVYQAYGIVRIMYSFMESPSNSFEFSNLYRPFYLRGTPFYAGMLAGVAVEMLKKRKIKFSMSVTYLTTVSVVVVSLWIQLYSASFYELDKPYNVLEQSVYAAIGHCTWAAILFCVTVFHFTSGYGPMEKLFNNRLIVPLGRLSYTVYLVNITIMMMIESRQSVSVSPTFKLLTDGWIVGTARTYFAGFLLYMVVEAPTGQLVKKLLYPKKKNDQPSQVDVNNRLDTTEQNNSTHF